MPGRSSCTDCSVRSLTVCNAAVPDMLDLLQVAPRTVPAGADLIPQGGACDDLIVMVQGWGCLYQLLEDGRRQILRFLLPGDVVGLLDEAAGARFGAQALTPLSACIVRRDRFLALARRMPELALELTRQLARQEALAYEHLTSVGRRNARERVAHLLLELFCRARAPATQADQMVLPLTQHHLADALGLTPVHVNRMLRELRQDGIIELAQRTLHVRDPDLLAMAAGVEWEVTVPEFGYRRLPRAPAAGMERARAG